MTWIVAPALETLRLQLNQAFPKRSKASDGGIGDAKHASRSSDHNPWVKDKKGTGIVTARDFTHDPKTGIDCEWLADTLVKNKDPRIKYIIWNKQICSSKTSPWKWRPYKGTNAHTKHLHLSVSDAEKHWNSKAPWDLDFPDDESDDVAKVTVPKPSAANQPVSSEKTETTSNPLETATAAEHPPIETTVTRIEDGAVVEASKTNQQDVNVPADVAAPEPYLGVGFWGVIKRDFTAATGGNLSLAGLSEYAQQASGWPPWIVGMISKLAIGVLIATFGYLIFRVIHYAIDTWKKNQKVKVEVSAATDVNRKDVNWI